MIRKNEVWVGRYQEDSQNYGFENSICVSGIDDKFSFIKDRLSELYNNYNIFYFSDPSWIYYMPSDLRDKCVFSNEGELYRWLNNKSISRAWVQNFVKTIPFAILSGKEILSGAPCKLFRGYRKVVAQKMISEGGDGTYLVNEDISLDDELYSVSPYFENAISINVTVILSKSDYAYFKPSLQIIEYTDNKLCYRGSDFIVSQQLPDNIIQKINESTEKLCVHLKKLNYLGICGIDYIIYNDDVYFIEFNPRFQGSSFLLDKALSEYGRSLIDINSDCFHDNISSEVKLLVKRLDIPYAFKWIDGKRQVFRDPILDASMDCSLTNYYDCFADIYHIMLPDWKNLVNTQGVILSKLFKRYAKIPVQDVLDCTCGIGVQAMSLKYLGYNVVGSDLSENELKWAREEANRRELSLTFVQADCRHLEERITNRFDAIISIDSAMPHLVTRDNFVEAFRSIYNRLRTGGVFISSYRDYAKLLEQRPELAYPIRFKEDAKNNYVIFRRWRWKGSLLYSRQYVIEENTSCSKLLTADYIQWAVTEDDLLPIAKEAGFSESYWLSSEESEFSQPIFCVVK